MIATIDLYEPLHERLKVKTKRGTIKQLVYVANFGPVAKVCPSERSAVNFLTKHGFVLSDDCTHYIHKYKSEDSMNLERNYRKV